MKKLSLFLSESVTNHLTPIGNILINVKNIFAIFGLVCDITDNNELLITSSKFTSEEATNSIMHDSSVVRGTSLYYYIYQQGLDDIKVVQNQGDGYSIVCKASDIEPTSNYLSDLETCKVKESFNTTLYSTFMEDEDELNRNVSVETQVISDLQTILNDNMLNIVQKADKIDYLIRKKVKLGDKWKVRAVKDESGNAFVVLRQTYDEKRPFNNTVAVTASRIAFIDTDDKGIFVYDADNKDVWSNEQKTMIDKILKLFRCKKSSDPFYYGIGEVEHFSQVAPQNIPTSDIENDKETITV